jgi:uncharacterized protein YgbK (DUF1537 family)
LSFLMKIGVIADDLTGALDTGLEFWRNGLKTLVVTSPHSLRGRAGSADVIVMDTGTRMTNSRRAHARVAKATELLKGMGARYFYKKVDSTLRGNVGTEIEAVMDELGIGATVLAPALPEQGRTTLGGHIYVHGKRLDRTPYVREGPLPTRGSHMPRLVKAQTDKRVGLITLSSVRRKLGAEMEAQRRRGAQIIVTDAVTRRDLRRICECMIGCGLGKLSCGSAGLAAELPVALGLCKRPLPALVLSGSVSEATRGQMRRLGEALEPKMAGLHSSALGKGGKGLKKARGALIEAIRNGQDAALYLRDGGGGLGPRETAKALASFRRSVSDIVEGAEVGGLVLVGGETAAQACQALGAGAMEIEDEAGPGLACARMLDGERRGLRIVSKAGGFGDEDALVRAVSFLKLSRP